MHIHTSCAGCRHTCIHYSYFVYVQAVAAAPVAVYFDVENDFQHYAGGIYSSVECSTQFNHAGGRVQLRGSIRLSTFIIHTHLLYTHIYYPHTFIIHTHLLSPLCG